MIKERVNDFVKRNRKTLEQIVKIVKRGYCPDIGLFLRIFNSRKSEY